MDETKLGIPETSWKLKCHLCGVADPAISCDGCFRMAFCIDCDGQFHNHPRRKHHTRVKIGSEYQDGTSSRLLKQEASPRLDPRSTNRATASSITRRNTEVHQRPLTTGQQNRNSTEVGWTTSGATWACEHCTFDNSSQARICEVCCKTRGLSMDEPSKLVGKKPETGQKVQQNRRAASGQLPGRSLGSPKAGDGKLNAKKSPQDGAAKTASDYPNDQPQKTVDENLTDKKRPQDGAAKTTSGYPNDQPQKTVDENLTDKKRPQDGAAKTTSGYPNDQPQKTVDENLTDKKRPQDGAAKTTSGYPNDRFQKSVDGNLAAKKSLQDGAAKTTSGCTSGYPQKTVDESLTAKKARPQDRAAKTASGSRADWSTMEQPETKKVWGKESVVQSVKERVGALEEQIENESKSNKNQGSHKGSLKNRNHPLVPKDNDANGILVADSTLASIPLLAQEAPVVGQDAHSKKPLQATNRNMPLENWMKEAEECGFTIADLEVAVNVCGSKDPVLWLRDHWQELVEDVTQLASMHGYNGANDVGILSATEAKRALQLHFGDRKQAVLECVKRRKKGFKELEARGRFPRHRILHALSSTDGDVEAAYLELCKNPEISKNIRETQL